MALRILHWLFSRLCFYMMFMGLFDILYSALTYKDPPLMGFSIGYWLVILIDKLFEEF